MEISWIDSVKNEVLQRAKEERNNLHTIKSWNAHWIGNILHRNCLLKHAVEGKVECRMEVTRRGGRRHKQLSDDLKETRGYCKLKSNH
jgi:hypothetical protein